MLPVEPRPAYRNCASSETASGDARCVVGTVRRVLPVRGSMTAIAGPVAAVSVDTYSSPEAGLYARSSGHEIADDVRERLVEAGDADVRDMRPGHLARRVGDRANLLVRLRRNRQGVVSTAGQVRRESEGAVLRDGHGHPAVEPQREVRARETRDREVQVVVVRGAVDRDVVHRAVQRTRAIRHGAGLPRLGRLIPHRDRIGAAARKQRAGERAIAADVQVRGG